MGALGVVSSSMMKAQHEENHTADLLIGICCCLSESVNNRRPKQHLQTWSQCISLTHWMLIHSSAAQWIDNILKAYYLFCVVCNSEHLIYDCSSRKCTIKVFFVYYCTIFQGHGCLLATDISAGDQVSSFPSVIWLPEVWHCLCWLTVKLPAWDVQHYLCIFC